MTCFLTWSLSFNPAILKVWPSDPWKSEIFSGVPMLKTIIFVNDTFFVILFWVHKTQLTSPQAESRGRQETFPSQPVVRPLHFYCPGLRLIPGGKTKMPQGAWQVQKKKRGWHKSVLLVIALMPYTPSLVLCSCFVLGISLVK